MFKTRHIHIMNRTLPSCTNPSKSIPIHIMCNEKCIVELFLICCFTSTLNIYGDVGTVN